MEVSSTMTQEHYCISMLEELRMLNSVSHERLPKTSRELAEDFQRSNASAASMFNQDVIDLDTNLDAEIRYRRRAQDEELRALRHLRENIFAIGFSAFERFLCLIAPEYKAKQYNSVRGEFAKLKAVFQKFDAPHYFCDEPFKTNWQKSYLYKVIRNKIMHQVGLIDKATKDYDEKEVLKNLDSAVFLEDCQLPGYKKIIVGQLALDGVLSFYIQFARDIEQQWGTRTC
jgi:hypothetical protein